MSCLLYTMKLDPNSDDVYLNLARVYRDKGMPMEALGCFQKALSLNPNKPGAYVNLGNLLWEQGRSKDAFACYQKAISLDPNEPSAYINLGRLISQQGRSLDPVATSALGDIGAALCALGEIDEGMRHLQKALELKPGTHDVLVNLGAALCGRGKIDEGRPHLEKAFKLKPDCQTTQYNLATCYLALGRFSEGWKLYESRWEAVEDLKSAKRGFAQPQWRGEPIEGRTILLHAEQGFGDTLQFVRYAPEVARRGGRVLLECPAPLVSLLQTVQGVTHVLQEGALLPNFEFHCPLHSLPLVFGTTLESIPSDIPYVAAHPEQVARWAANLGTTQSLKAGLVWSGNRGAGKSWAILRDKERSLPLAAFEQFGSVAGIRYVSLQKGEAAAQAKNPPEGLVISDPSDKLQDFADTAALIANLDLVISVDTSVAHLAGAMGKPVWLLSRFNGCWRWLVDHEDSPWYPTMRILRQPKLGDWDSVIERAAEELRMLVVDGIPPNWRSG